MKNISLTPPEWFARSAVYQVNLRTFSKEGTIKSLTAETEFLKSLGFGTVYLCPIFCEDNSEDRKCWSERQIKSKTENPKNPYRINDYFFIDSEYGTMEDLAEFVETAHKNGIRVLLDLVYAHIGPNAPIIRRHPEFVKQTADGETVYTEWNFPALDFNCHGLREYLYCNMVYYVGVVGVDGFRCDVGDAVPGDFWLEARRRIQTVKSDAVLINEGDKVGRLAVSFDSTYFFAWHEMLYKIFCSGESAEILRQTDEQMTKKLPKGGKLMRDIDNHDTVTDWPQRTENAAGHDAMEQIEVINYLADGIPMVYCGNEIACGAKLSLFANRFHMGNFEVTDRENKSTPAALRRQSVIKILNDLKRDSDILRHGDMKWLDNSAPQSVISFERTYGGESLVFVGNAKDSTVSVKADGAIGGEVLFSNGFDGIDNGEIKLSERGYVVIKK